MVRDRGGNFYGTTAGGGAWGPGTVFKLSPAGTETVLYSFTGGADGGPQSPASCWTLAEISTAQPL
ncbi:MAG: choice-of-anchor tandem repeat GloVer-containing protein [Bryobacteraceae bacterium]